MSHTIAPPIPKQIEKASKNASFSMWPLFHIPHVTATRFAGRAFAF